ncbi:MAG: YraN family protein [Rhodothermales bacterium]|nr:YraN family protein [Rhodothermales bacterium]
MPSTRQKIGDAGESIAAAYLEQHGYMILERKYRFMKSEVDLVAFLPHREYERGGDLVFIEVKWRRSASWGHPEESVDDDKRRHMVRAARAFLHERKLEGTPCRFDVVAIEGRPPDVDIRHIESAFVA